MGWSHYLGMLVLIAIGVFIGAKYPALLGKATGGVVTA